MGLRDGVADSDSAAGAVSGSCGASGVSGVSWVSGESVDPVLPVCGTSAETPLPPVARRTGRRRRAGVRRDGLSASDVLP